MNVGPHILYLVTLTVYIAGVITHKEGMGVNVIVSPSQFRIVWHAPFLREVGGYGVRGLSVPRNVMFEVPDINLMMTLHQQPVLCVQGDVKTAYSVIMVSSFVK